MFCKDVLDVKESLNEKMWTVSIISYAWYSVVKTEGGTSQASKKENFLILFTEVDGIRKKIRSRRTEG